MISNEWPLSLFILANVLCPLILLKLSAFKNLVDFSSVHFKTSVCLSAWGWFVDSGSEIITELFHNHLVIINQDKHLAAPKKKTVWNLHVCYQFALCLWSNVSFTLLWTAPGFTCKFNTLKVDRGLMFYFVPDVWSLLQTIQVHLKVM